MGAKNALDPGIQTQDVYFMPQVESVIDLSLTGDQLALSSFPAILVFEEYSCPARGLRVRILSKQQVRSQRVQK